MCLIEYAFLILGMKNGVLAAWSETVLLRELPRENRVETNHLQKIAPIAAQSWPLVDFAHRRFLSGWQGP